MSTAEEQAIRVRLHAELDGLPAGPLPARAVLRRGRLMRWQRRGAAAAALAVIIALGATLPAALSRPRHATPAAGPGHERVTVYAPQPGAPRGEIAQGRVNGRGWRIVLSGPARSITVNGPLRHDHGDLPDEQEAAFDEGAPSGGPGMFQVWGGGPVLAVAGQVAPQVTRLTVRLQGGKVLTLHPIGYRGGSGYIAFGLPAGLGVTYITAYGQHGEIARMVPFNYSGRYAEPDPGPQFFGLWNRPGQPAQARVTRQLRAVPAPGARAVSVRVSAGPWGTCWRDSVSGLACEAVTLAGMLPAGKVIAPMVCDMGGGPVFSGMTGPGVRQVRFRLPDGQWLRMPTVAAAGPFRFYAGVLPLPQVNPGAWQALDATGHVLGSGRHLPC